MKHFFSYLLVVLLALVICASFAQTQEGETKAPAKCQDALTETCRLSPYENELALKDQVFCPRPNTATGLERQGTGCSSLQYCCQAINSFDNNGSFRSAFGISGIGYSVQDGFIVIPAGQTVRLEFKQVACVARIGISTNSVVSNGSVLITSYFLPDYDSSPVSVDAPLSRDGSSSVATVDECLLAAISFKAPTDSALYIQNISLCLLDSQLDACGVCNGNGSSCAASAAAESTNVNVLNTWFPLPPAPVVPTIYCHRKHDEKCCTVFGYKFDSETSFVIPVDKSHNHLIPRPAYQNQPSFFVSGGQEAAFEAYWNCTNHQEIHLKWQVNTETSIRSVKIVHKTDEWPNGVQVHRNNKQHCPSYMCTF